MTFLRAGVPPHDTLNALLGALLMRTVTQQVLRPANHHDLPPFPVDRHIARLLRTLAPPFPR